MKYKDIEYTVTRSERKTIAIHIRGSRVEVRAPVHLPQSSIERYLIKKEKWLMSHLALQLYRLEGQNAFNLDYGSTVLYRGKEYPIVRAAKSGDKAEFDGSAFIIPPGLTPEGVKAACVRLYISLAKEYLPGRTYELSGKVDVHPNAVKINSAKSRWGSCTSLGNINFSWLTVMAPDDVIDYLIIHELAHLRVMGHSLIFWSLVRHVLPDLKDRKSRLSVFQERVLSENWDV